MPGRRSSAREGAPRRVCRDIRMTGSTPRVSVVVPVFQGERVIGDCLVSVLGQTFPHDQYEIVVVNNGSTDRTGALVEGFPVRVVEEPRLGVAFARNRGVEAARGELVAFTDADCLAEPTWLAALVAHFDAHVQLAGVGGHLPGYDPRTPVQYYIPDRRLLSQERALGGERGYAPFLITANALLVRRLIVEVGGFDTAFATNSEDADLCWRIGDLGYGFGFAPEAVVWHRHRGTLRALCRWMFRYGRESAYLLKKHRHRCGIRWVHFDWPHYGQWLLAIGRFCQPWPLRAPVWERRFAGYDILRSACYTAGRVVGSIENRAIIL